MLMRNLGSLDRVRVAELDAKPHDSTDAVRAVPVKRAAVQVRWNGSG